MIARLEEGAREFPPTYLLGMCSMFDRGGGVALLVLTSDDEVVVTRDHRAFHCALQMFVSELWALIEAAVEEKLANMGAVVREAVLRDPEQSGESAFLDRNKQPILLDADRASCLVDRSIAILEARARHNVASLHECVDWTIDARGMRKLASLRDFKRPSDVTAADVAEARNRIEVRLREWFVPVESSPTFFAFDAQRFCREREIRKASASAWAEEQDLLASLDELYRLHFPDRYTVPIVETDIAHRSLR